MAAPVQEWTNTIGNKSYLISTDKAKLDRTFIRDIFACSDTYWTKSVSERSLNLLIANSCSFGVYLQPPDASNDKNPKQIGLARLVTDYATLAYLTDVLILEEHRGGGLGRWLIGCVDEVVQAMPDLRRFLLLTSKGSKTVPFYEGFGLSAASLEADGLCVMVKKGPGAV